MRHTGGAKAMAGMVNPVNSVDPAVSRGIMEPVRVRAGFARRIEGLECGVSAMVAKFGILSALAVATSLAAGGFAHAESASMTLTNAAAPAGAQTPARHSYQWGQKGRWSLTLDLNQASGRDVQLHDLQAGAYYRLTPSLRVGGAVSLSDGANQPSGAPLPQTQAPRVKLETSFKF